MIIASVEQLDKTYGTPGSDICVHALRGVNLSIQQGESVAICGHSGSGKSTLMNVLGCLDRPTGGRYLLGNEDVSQMDDDRLSEIRGQRIGFVFQNFNLIPQLTVLENLEVPLFYQGTSAARRREKAWQLVELVGLADRAAHRPNELSGGQQQRVAVARALINDPLLILADEPTGNLDTATGETILALFADLQKQGKTIVMVTHEAEIAARCNRIITMRDGRIISDEPGRSTAA